MELVPTNKKELIELGHQIYRTEMQTFTHTRLEKLHRYGGFEKEDIERLNNMHGRSNRHTPKYGYFGALVASERILVKWRFRVVLSHPFAENKKKTMYTLHKSKYIGSS